MNKLLTILLLCAPYCAVNAAPYTPQSNDEIIARWPATANDKFQSLKAASHLQPDNPQTVTALANAYLEQAAQPGQSRFYGLAQAALKPLIEKNIPDKNVWLAWAQVQQHQHNFFIAQNAIAKVLEQDPTNINANLLAARIYVIQDKSAAARNACLKILGTADLLTVTACSLEANSYLHPNDLKNTYQQLADMVKREGLPNDERANWIIQLLADLALRNQQPAVGEEWLEIRLTNASVNYLAQWADVKLALHNPQAVLVRLAPIVKSAMEMDDALLLRLALAEKELGLKPEWQTQLAERVSLREQRQDSLHASELAIYYLDLAPDAKKALFWAETNFANTREYNDKNLLARAKYLNQSKEM
ncbi:hypothetical protein GCM10011613_29520 [Cellvibrio zantedeschiae]|uniref:Tetratricopeptide repeat protein n=1 Tax=Cellvibrio zantedeschiae TaxID=1237077 RepID=A0ABQ3BA75_9GAMM|nr:hypothetical protein [Cellvibrio zantedeschiae]GGY82773.1 hypothetical protein GCM10011613_29520 [Cellvibrio zantedeschiae]